MTNDWEDVPRSDPWVEFAMEKVNLLLIGQELAQEDRNGTFTWIAVVGALFIGSSWWHFMSNAAHVAEWTDALGLAAGIVALIGGLALRVNGQIDLRRIRRQLKIASTGKFPEGLGEK